jgi:flagellar hook-length control protein FliK
MAKTPTSSDLQGGTKGAAGKAGEQGDIFSKIFTEQSVIELSSAEVVPPIMALPGDLSAEQEALAALSDLELSALSPEELQALVDGAPLPLDGKALPLPSQAADQADLATASVVLPVQAAVDAATRAEHAAHPATPTTALNAATAGKQGSGPVLPGQPTAALPDAADEGMPRWFSLLRGDTAVAPAVAPAVAGEADEHLDLRAQVAASATTDAPRTLTTGGTAAVQPLGMPMEQSAGAPLQLKLSTPVNQQGWDRGVGQQVLWMVNNKQQTAQIRLNPPELGPIEVKVSVQNDTAQVQFTAMYPLASPKTATVRVDAERAPIVVWPTPMLTRHPGRTRPCLVLKVSSIPSFSSRLMTL